MGLLEDDVTHRRCLQEVAVMNMPSQMRQLFSTLMVFQTPSDIRALFEEFKEAICEDYIRHDQLHDPETTLQEIHIHLCLWNIDICLRVHGKSISAIEFSDLPQLPNDFIQPEDRNEDIDIVHEREHVITCYNSSTMISDSFMTQLFVLVLVGGDPWSLKRNGYWLY